MKTILLTEMRNVLPNEFTNSTGKYGGSVVFEFSGINHEQKVEADQKTGMSYKV